MPPETTYPNMVKEILSNFGDNIYVYQHKLKTTKQGDEPFGHFVFSTKENVLKMCELANATDLTSAQDLIVKDQILRSVDRNLAEFLKERNIFQISLDKIGELGDNYQAIHGKTTKNPKNIPYMNALNERLCHTCREPGHIAKFCRFAEKNFAGTQEPLARGDAKTKPEREN